MEIEDYRKSYFLMKGNNDHIFMPIDNFVFNLYRMVKIKCFKLFSLKPLQMSN